MKNEAHSSSMVPIHTAIHRVSHKNIQSKLICSFLSSEVDIYDFSYQLDDTTQLLLNDAIQMFTDDLV